jgi:hypothetical protein
MCVVRILMLRVLMQQSQTLEREREKEVDNAEA